MNGAQNITKAFKYPELPTSLSVTSASRSVLMIGICCLAVQTVFAQSSGDRSINGPDMTYFYDGPRVTFSQIYNDPSNLTLNLNYAKQQAALGDLLGSAAALERLLYAEPNWHSARLFYAAILYRLDDKKAAWREMQLLDGRNMNPEQTSLYQDYSEAFKFTPTETALSAYSNIDLKAGQRAVIKDGSSQSEPSNNVVISRPTTIRDRLSGRFALGARLDSQAGNAIADLNLGTIDETDASAFLQGALRLRTPIESMEETFFYASLNGQSRRHEDFSHADYDTIGGGFGLSFGPVSSMTSIGLNLDQIYISGEKYLSQVGPNLSYQHALPEDTMLRLSLGVFSQTYKNLSIAPAERGRTGSKAIGYAGLTKKVSPSTSLGAGFGIEAKDANNSDLSYTGIKFDGHTSHQLDNGVLLKGRMNYRRLHYSQVGTFSSQIDRENRFNARGSMSVALNQNSDIRTGARAEAAVNYNVRSFEGALPRYENIGGELKLIWDFN